MPQYSVEQARASEERPMEEVYDYYHDLANQRRPVIDDAIANLTGHGPTTSASEAESSEPAANESDADEPDLDDSEGDLPEDPPES